MKLISTGTKLNPNGCSSSHTAWVFLSRILGGSTSRLVDRGPAPQPVTLTRSIVQVTRGICGRSRPSTGFTCADLHSEPNEGPVWGHDRSFCRPSLDGCVGWKSDIAASKTSGCPAPIPAIGLAAIKPSCSTQSRRSLAGGDDTCLKYEVGQLCFGCPRRRLDVLGFGQPRSSSTNATAHLHCPGWGSCGLGVRHPRPAGAFVGRYYCAGVTA